MTAACAHGASTSGSWCAAMNSERKTYQSVHDSAVPLEALDEAGRERVWQRLLASLNEVAAVIGDEAHVGAETIRLGNDIAACADVAHVLDKMARAKVDPAFDGNEAMRENTLVFLEGQRCQAMATHRSGAVRRWAC